MGLLRGGPVSLGNSIIAKNPSLAISQPDGQLGKLMWLGTVGTPNWLARQRGEGVRIHF